MKKLLITTAALAALGSSAFAADMPVKAPYYKAPPPPACVWCGFYIGANVGYGWEQRTGSIDPVPALFGAPAAVAGGFVPSTLGVRPQGVIGGGQIGYNWQNGPWVWGLETDFQGSGIKNTNTIVFPGSAAFVPSTTTASDQTNWFGTLRLRAGFLAAPNLLLYGTGGLAYGRVQESYQLVGAPPVAGFFVGNANTTRAGWAAGAGAEWKVTANVSLKAEYLHIDLGTSTVSTTDPLGAFPGLALNYDFHHYEDIARVGINYQFSGPVVARY